MGQSVATLGTTPRLEDKYFVQKVKLGEGTFGTVWRAIDKNTGEPVAVKMLDKAYVRQLRLKREDIELEISIQSACDHENITRLYEHFEDNQCMFLILEYCDGGDFADKAMERGLDMTEAEVAFWMTQVCNAVAALHTKDVCHRDIKATNFMLRTNGTDGNRAQEKVVLKLSDFGLATWAPKGQLLRRRCGTNFYMAPEVEKLPDRSKGYGVAADVWSTGVLMYVLMLGDKHPCSSNGKYRCDRLAEGELDFRETQRAAKWPASQQLMSCTRPSQAPTSARLRFSDEARDLCTRMVQVDPEIRVTASVAAQAAEAWCRNMPWVHPTHDAHRMLSLAGSDSAGLWQQMVTSVSAQFFQDESENAKASSRMPILKAEKDQSAHGPCPSPRKRQGCSADRSMAPDPQGGSWEEKPLSSTGTTRSKTSQSDSGSSSRMQVESLKDEVRSLRAALATPRSRHSTSYELPEVAQDSEDAGGRLKQIESLSSQVEELKKELDRKKQTQDFLIKEREHLELHISQQEELVQAQAEQLMQENRLLRAELEQRKAAETDMAWQKQDLEARVEQLTARTHRSTLEEQMVRKVREDLEEERRRLDLEREQLRCREQQLQEMTVEKEKSSAAPLVTTGKTRRLRMPFLKRQT